VTFTLVLPVFLVVGAQVHSWCGWPDHFAPSIALLFKICSSIYRWLREDPQNVVILHCLVTTQISPQVDRKVLMPMNRQARVERGLPLLPFCSIVASSPQPKRRFDTLHASGQSLCGV